MRNKKKPIVTTTELDFQKELNNCRQEKKTYFFFSPEHDFDKETYEKKYNVRITHDMVLNGKNVYRVIILKGE